MPMIKYSVSLYARINTVYKVVYGAYRSRILVKISNLVPGSNECILSCKGSLQGKCSIYLCADSIKSSIIITLLKPHISTHIPSGIHISPEWCNHNFRGSSNWKCFWSVLWWISTKSYCSIYTDLQLLQEYG